MVFVHGLCTNDHMTNQYTALYKQHLVEKPSELVLPVYIYIDIYAFTPQNDSNRLWKFLRAGPILYSGDSFDSWNETANLFLFMLFIG